MECLLFGEYATPTGLISVMRCKDGESFKYTTFRSETCLTRARSVRYKVNESAN